ncbi:glycoside hydrolase family 3 C-terminal domain-containing protein [Gemmiger sp.]
MAKNKKKGNGVVLWSVLTGVSAVAFGAACVGTNLANASAQAVNIALKTSTNKTVNKDDSVKYFETGFDSVEDLEAHDKEIAEQLTGEGAVLLKNNGALPLAAGDKVSTLSHSSVGIATCGTGSADIDTSKSPTLKEALEADGLEVNPTLWDFYLTGEGSKFPRNPSKDTDATGIKVRSDYNVNEVPMDVYTDDVKSSFASYGDAAIITITRLAGEMYDVPIDGFTDGTDALQLTQEEKDLLKMARENFDKVIVLINSTNALQCDFLTDDSYGVDAALWIGYTGTWGLNAVADILTGEVNPSGHLVDTYCNDNSTAPSLVNFYGKMYANATEDNNEDWYDFQLDGNKYYNAYQEGIYVGYRYYETRYEDVVLGQGNAGDYDYNANVAYPFGYGLSYTTFDWSDFKSAYDAATDSFNVSVDVKNTGNVAGKEVVQVYFQSPYTDYDKANSVEKASVELCGFGKTEILEPGATETVTVNVPRSELAAYDANGAKTYILDAGDYYLTAAHDAHDAVNNVLAAKGYTVENGMTADGNADMAWNYNVAGLDTTTYSVSAATGETITNQFDNADPSYYGVEGMSYLSRSDWQGTWPQELNLEANEAMLVDLNLTGNYTADPNSDAVMPTMGADNGMTLGMMIGKSYDDPDWDKLLDQVTFDEMATLVGQGYHSTAMLQSVSKPRTLDDNGPQGFTQSLTGISTNHCAYSDENIMAATFNTDLMNEVGKCIGNDVMDLGASGLYGPAMDTHRNAYCGRNFEYYSEDGFLSGKIAAAEISGIQSKGVYVYMKHFALNDSETKCRCISTWANEQSIREIYLKPFEMSVTEGGALGVMNAFARVGATWSGADVGLMTNVLRNEWGFEGFVITDFSGNPMFTARGIALRTFDAAYGVLAGTDTWDSSDVQWTTELTTQYKDCPEVVQAMRQATHRILYVVANSCAMNGFTADTKIVKVTPWWQTALIVLDVVLAVLVVVCIWRLVVAIKRKKNAAKAEDQQ